MRRSALRRAASTATPATPACSALLDWSAKQSRILTAASAYLLHYAPGTFSDDELPHHRMRRGDAHDAFREWRAAAAQQQQRAQLPAWLTGAWNRRRFVGGLLHEGFHCACARQRETSAGASRAVGGPSHAVCAWLLEHAAMLLNVRLRGRDGRTPLAPR
mgnify:CR=1 FL=1